MRWLLTLRRDVDRAALRRRLAACGAELDRHAPPVPLGEGEQAVAAEGPGDLPARLADDELVCAVHPDSEMSYFGEKREPEDGC